MWRAALASAAAVLVAARTPAQDVRQLIDDLGDVERSEAAEVELLRLGETAGTALADYLTRLGTGPFAQRDQRRLRTALVLIDLLGADAVSAAPALTTLIKANPPGVMTDLVGTMINLVPHIPREQVMLLFQNQTPPEAGSEDEVTRYMCRTARLHRTRPVTASDSAQSLLDRLHNNLIFEREASSGAVDDVQCECYAMLSIAPGARPDELVEMASGSDPAIRLAALRRLAASEDLRHSAASVQAFLADASSEHPRTFAYKESPRSARGMMLNLDARIQAVAAVALVGSEVPAELKPALLATALKHEDAEAAAAAVRTWAGVDVLPVLVRALEDRRSTVLVAAAMAIGALGPEAATAIPSLEKALATAKDEPEQALRAALDKVRSGGRD